MKMHKLMNFALALGLILGLAQAAYAEEAACFALPEGAEGVLLTAVPEVGTLTLGDRVLAAGDALTADQAAQVRYLTPEGMTLLAATEAADSAAQTSGTGEITAVFRYLSVSGGQAGAEQTVCLAVGPRNDPAPVAQDSALETYKNLAVTGQFTCADPEGEAVTYTIVRKPRRGTVELGEDGSFVYTPKRNKLGTDSFTYTATDPAGNVSREATVTVTVLKPSDSAQYTDTRGLSCQFAAEWMRHTGIFTGEKVGQALCFRPEAEVTRGEFVTMLVKALDIPVDEGLTYTGYTDQIPDWLQPYLAAAVRAGVTLGLDDPSAFHPDAPITQADAAVMLHNALTEVPTWAADGQAVLTRADAAELLLQATTSA